VVSARLVTRVLYRRAHMRNGCGDRTHGWRRSRASQGSAL